MKRSGRRLWLITLACRCHSPDSLIPSHGRRRTAKSRRIFSQRVLIQSPARKIQWQLGWGCPAVAEGARSDSENGRTTGRGTGYSQWQFIWEEGRNSEPFVSGSKGEDRGCPESTAGEWRRSLEAERRQHAQKTMSVAARRKISAAQRLRWAKVRARKNKAA